MSTLPTLPRLLELQKLLQKFAKIDRVLERKHGKTMRAETDTEHSYNLAMTAWYLAPYFPELNKDSVIRLALAHDLVEIHAGDTYIYASETELASKPARERAAAEQLRTDWPDFAEMHETITEYEERQTPEARFIYALDKIMPVMLIYIHDGYTWKKHDISVAMLHEAKRDKVAISPEIQLYYDALRELLLASPHLIKPS